MQPSAANVAEFLAFAPQAGEGNAFLFLKARAGANTVEEAVTAYYHNPAKYSGGAKMTSGKSNAEPMTSSDGSETLPAYRSAEQSPIQNHTNAVIQAADIRARDEQEMQNMLQTVQFQYRIYNPDLEPEHELEQYCNCLIHQYKRRKWERRKVQEMWSKAVISQDGTGEKAYDNLYFTQAAIFTNNAYRFKVVSPYYGRNAYGWGQSTSLWQSWSPPRPDPNYYTQYLQETIELNAMLNAKAQSSVEAREPAISIWEIDDLAKAASALTLEGLPQSKNVSKDSVTPSDDKTEQKQQKIPVAGSVNSERRQSWFKKVFSGKTPEEKEARRLQKLSASCGALRNSILQEEHARWPTQEWRRIVHDYQWKVGMTEKIAELRQKYPIQYLHLLRAGYFEPIPVAWADQASNPLKFTIEGMEGWRGITPTWRGFEDTAEERLYWVLNHRQGLTGQRLKPDIISALEMARRRMASAVEPPPQYFSATDTCHVQHTTEGYSKQVMPPQFRAFDAPETAADDTMILLDVSGCTDVAKAIIRRFVDAMINHSHNGRGYQLTTFANHARFMGMINHTNFETVWKNVVFGGGTRVMTGWQRVKRLHFEKHRESATLHPIYGWQAGPKTPMLRLLLLLDGEATDMDEFELDLLGNSWAHVTVFLIGVDGCPHHHRHANELQRISEVNHHVSFVDAQGNMPERLVTHELLKRHLGYEVSMAEMEQLSYPGFGKPLNWMPLPAERFPALLEDDWRASTLTIRELFMLWFTEQITNKPSWQAKVYDDAIVEKWRAEADHVDWSKAIGYQHESPCSDAMWVYMIQELRSKAKLYGETGMIPIFDTSAAVIKSDVAISAELRRELKDTSISLEKKPEDEKDWHPGSDGKVLDLVHPSLWPLVYGRTRILPPDSIISLNNCLEEMSSGQVVPEPHFSDGQKQNSPSREYHTNKRNPWSRRFQWLPSDIELGGSTPKIVGYINNLHPVEHQNLYGVIEKIIEVVLPFWDLVYRWPEDFHRLRIPCTRAGRRCTTPEICTVKRRYGCDMSSRPLQKDEEQRPEWLEYRRLHRDHPLIVKDKTWFHATHSFEQPEPQAHEESDEISAHRLRFFNFFPTSEKVTPRELGWPADRIQVIVKLANIQLTPEKPTYNGGSWHIEGQLNEHICATAIYYYDCENITPSHLAFRTRANGEDLERALSYEQNDYESIMATFGIHAKGDTLQDLGKVLTRQGRLVAFPNVYQHRVTPFELKDKSKPGHRKILALFLVDPKIPIISTASVPPQQSHWRPAPEEVPVEDWPISLEEAKQTRLELMSERTAMEREVDDALQDDQWSFFAEANEFGSLICPSFGGVAIPNIKVHSRQYINNFLNVSLYGRVSPRPLQLLRIMPYPFVLPTTSAFAFSNAFACQSHPSLPLTASTYRGVVRDILKKHKRLGPSAQNSNLTVVVSNIEAYLPYLLAIDAGLTRQPVGATEQLVSLSPKNALLIEWRPTLSGEVVPGRERTRIKILSLEHEIFFTLSTLAFAHVATARACLQPLYSTTGEVLGAQQRTTVITTATKYLLEVASIYDYLGRRGEKPAAVPQAAPPCVDVCPSTARAMSSLALAEATLLAILKDDPYPATVAQDRNVNDTEWMYKAPDIPKVRAHLFARLALAASEHAAKAVALCQSAVAAPGVNSKISSHLIRYMEDLRRTSRAKACRFFGIDAELGGETADGIGWARAGLQELGVDISEKNKKSGSGLGFSRLKKELKERREDRRVDGDGSAWGSDAGRLEETRILELLDAKWSKINDTMNTKAVPPPATLLPKMPSGRDIHTIKPYSPPALGQDILDAMRAPPEREDDLDGDLSSDAEETGSAGPPPGAFPGGAEYSGGRATGTSYY
ncbi:hypothetical protein PWT90_08600 [Aphanocladium album]|nr:hypothetical protein PWT90_08600 [Aphanocladium album]